MTESYPPLPLDEQIRTPKPLPAWWTRFVVDLPSMTDYTLPKGKNYRYLSWYYKPPGWVPGATAGAKGIKIGPRQRETLRRLGAEPDRWFTLREIRQWWTGDGSIYQSIAALVKYDFLIAAPADDCNVPYAKGKLPHYWKYKFLRAAE